MWRPDYGSLYKFLVSAGLALIALAVALPWVVSQTTDGLLLTQQDVDALSNDARDLWTAQVRTARLVQSSWPVISVILSLAGTLVSIYGGVRWSDAQAVQDRREQAELQLAEQVAVMSAIEIDAKAEAEAVEQQNARGPELEPGPTTATQTLDATKEKILGIESQVITLLHSAFKMSHRGRPHVKVQSGGRVTIADSLLEARDSAYVDIITEVKYLFGPQAIPGAMIQLASASTLYEEATGRSTHALLITVVQRPARPDDYPRREQQVRRGGDRAGTLLTNSIQMAIFREDDLQQLDPAGFLVRLPPGVGRREPSE